MGFKVRAYHELTRHLLADVADAHQFVLHGLAFGVRRSVGVFEREGPGEHARAHHHGDEARAFLVRPEGDFDRRLGLDAVVVERAHPSMPASTP